MRGPFEGTWQQGIRPTVVTAPDALVYINGETQMIGCNSCHRRFDFNKYITSIQTDLHVDSAPGSASISMSIPRHSVDEFYFDGDPLITPMMEVEIFAKGYFLVEGVPQYYPIFWGLITSVSDNYSGGEHTFSINCSDILKWWELCKMNINPAFTAPAGSGQLGGSIFGNVLFGTNPYDMIWTLAQQAFGDVVVGTGSLVSLYKEGLQKKTFNAALSDIMQYWQYRFGKIRSNLMMYGTQGNAVRGDQIYQAYQKNGAGKKFDNAKTVPTASQVVRNANGGKEGSQMIFDPTSSEVTAFRTQFSQAGQVNFWTSEFQTKLEIANACKEAIGFEFFMDVTGDIVFKPPFYNLDIVSNKPVSWIQEIDIIDWNLDLSEAEVVTQIQMSGSFGGSVDYGLSEECTPQTSVTDYHLLRQFGWRTQTFNSEFSASPLQMFYIGLDMLDRMNSRRFHGSITIPFRPELRLGFPIYLAPKDQVWYVAGISHNIAFGSRATTTLTLTAKRKKFIAPKGIGTIQLTGYSGGGKGAPTTGSAGPMTTGLTTQQLASGGQFQAKVGDAAQLPPTNYPDPDTADNPYSPLILTHPKTGRILGYPNVVMAYTRPFANPTPQDMAKASGQKDPNAKRGPAQQRKNVDKAGPALVAQFNNAKNTAGDKDKLREKYLNNRYSYGLNSAGVYTYLGDTSQVIKEILILPAKNIQFDPTTEKLKFDGASGMIRPVSDERGFELIGHFRYGRGVSLRDGSLVLGTPGSNNSTAAVNYQLAMSGQLLAALQAQSSGLTTANSLTTNPSATLAVMQPEDLESAATINPSTKETSMVQTPPNFVAAAPLGTPQQAGVTNMTSTAAVEASQLSRALTLAEMAVNEGVVPNDGTECDCLLSRSDLAFINTGYQVSVIGNSAADNSSISFGSSAVDPSLAQRFVDLKNQENAAANAAQEAAQQQNAQDLQGQTNPAQFNITATERIVNARTDAITAFQANHQSAYDEIGTPALTETGASDKPVADMMLSHTATIGKVEAFLVGLYTALDTPHQELEKGLRGEALVIPQINPQDIRFGTPSDLGPLAPPFGVSGAGGRTQSLDSLVDQAQDDLNAASQAASDFNQNLAAETKRGELTLAIHDLQKQADQANAIIAQLQELADEGLGDPPPQSQIDAANALTTQLNNKTQQLNQLNQQFPPA